ncbi:lipid kinase, YegS/Rv2252/BmrU family [Carnobacterium iners]|uniref:Lipid kinase, YegS/Rv2252/BmrU family n=1 Tax=Carnobacterium iners TaxID=1073423 RepID=A0A1X7NBM3_9LACT|nr:diacylglycerol kinase family protein [Carnobacterium iners]SEL11136.1 lipid kinase, YegS/Rv2252/BmrU family [Carnobacterium iners]SMH34988.1 lipid kinase, YegS/Rv2252/BmrU family [Carnobacterium iners]
MKAMIVVNPSSGSAEAKEYVSQLKTRLEEKFDEIAIRETEKAGDALKFSAQASKEKFEAVFLMGGDGTVNEGINGIAKQDYQPDVGIIPLGTVNNFARVLGMSMKPEEAISQLDLNHKKNVDIGKVNDQFFVSTVSIGSIPETVQHVDEESKEKFGSLAYFLEGVKALNNDETSTYQMTLDGQDFEEEYSMVLVGLSSFVFGIETVFSLAKMDDGYFNMLCLKETTVTEKIKLIPELLNEDENYSDKLSVKRFKSADLKTKNDKKFNTTVDGDKGPAFPVHFEIYPQFLTLFVPND